TMIHSLAGQLEEGHLVKTRPFRDPHHSASMPALVGGGMRAQPGEVSLAHHGVLFLDELPEFSRQTLEALRQPLETGKTLVSRANHHYTYPAQVQLVAAMNPCRCGYMAGPERVCRKAPTWDNDYQRNISGPLFDRIDIHVDVPEVSAMDLSQAGQGEPSDVVAQHVHKAREIQRMRYEDMQAEILLNAHADGEVLEKVTALNAECQALMHE